MIEKYTILLRHFRDGQSLRQISRDTGISRPTVTRYIAEYVEHKQRLTEALTGDSTDETASELIRSVVDAPRYAVTSRPKRKITEELIARVRELLAENAQKRSRGQHKQQMKICDMHAVLQTEEYNVGYRRLCTLVRDLDEIPPERFIRQTYTDGAVCEVDWGEVKLRLAGELKRIQMAIVTSAKGNYRYAWLSMKQDTAAFQQSHALFFEHLGGVYRELVYDTMKVAVKRFVGPTEKEATQGLLSLSLYYRFRFRFCNVRRGNEKGHVERRVEYVRRKAFSVRDEVVDLVEANGYLLEVCTRLNARPQKANDGQTAQDILDGERPYLLPVGPRFECGELRELRVDTYSTIRVDTCRYSVPERYVGQMMQVRVYPDRIRCYADGQCVCQHTRRYGRDEWSLTLAHDLQTRIRKPGALAGSLALTQRDQRLQAIYTAYYAERPKEFIDLVQYMTTTGKSLEQIETVIQRLRQTGIGNLTTDMIKMVCGRAQEAPFLPANTDIEQAASAQLVLLAGLRPNQIALHGGPIL